MRVMLILKALNSYALDYNYNYYIHAFLYSALRFGDKEWSDALYMKRGPKFFCFSQLFFEQGGKRTKESIKISEGDIARLYVSSPYEKFLFSSIQGFIKLKRLVKIGDSYWEIKDMKVLEIQLKNNLFDTLSPITVSIKKEGKIYDVPPHDGLFYVQLKNNLLKKYLLFYGKEYEGELDISPAFVSHVKPKRIKVKNTYHMAYHIKGLQIIGSSEIVKLAYDAGLGEKNSMGFGMIVEEGVSNV